MELGRDDAALVVDAHEGAEEAVENYPCGQKDARSRWPETGK
jgi:hypothetical protein